MLGKRVGGLTAVPLLRAVALQHSIAPVVPHPRFLHAPARATVHVPRSAALVMGHLVRVHVSDFSKIDPQTQPLLRQHHVAVAANADTCELLGGSVPAMH